MSRYAIDAEDLLLVAAHRASNFDETNPEKTLILAEAQVLATLALAEQQRIANLIAYVVKLSSHPTDISQMHATDIANFRSMSNQIREGLGIE